MKYIPDEETVTFEFACDLEDGKPNYATLVDYVKRFPQYEKALTDLAVAHALFAFSARRG